MNFAIRPFLTVLTVTVIRQRRKRKLKKRFLFANDNINELFNYDKESDTYDINIKLIKLMKKANELIANGLARSISIRLDNTLSAVIAMDSKKTIKVTKKKIYTDTMEIADD